MTQSIHTASLTALRLPQLQARFSEIIGEPTRCPNRRYLTRRIEEALAEQAKTQRTARALARRQAREARSPAPASEARAAMEPAEPTEAAAPEEPTEAEEAPFTPRQWGRFAGLTLSDLQAEYQKIIGRPTGSRHQQYLEWKIREAEKGNIPPGTRPGRTPEGEPGDYRILPLRLEAAAIDAMDQDWRALGLKSRMQFIRQALGHYLTHCGKAATAALISPSEAAAE